MARDGMVHVIAFTWVDFHPLLAQQGEQGPPGMTSHASLGEASSKEKTGTSQAGGSHRALSSS